jgi:F0F1-type ATP synthase assembly protein I
MSEWHLTGSLVPTSNSDSGNRPVAGRILRVQVGVGAAVALLSLAFWGRTALISALFGAATGVIANAYMMFKALRPARTARAALAAVYMGQVVKFALTVAAFMWAARLPHVSWLALMSAYVGTLAVSWWVPMTATPRKIGSEGASLQK